MFNRFNSDQWLGLFASLGAVLLIFVWVPLDVETGLVEKVRRQLTIGDALAPTVAGVVILLGGVLCFARPNAGDPKLGADNLRWLAVLVASITLSLLVMRYVGPALVELITEPSYRALRATPPWNYIGYLLGGTVLIAGLNAAINGRLRPRAVLVGFAASLIIAMLYDLPFDDLQLPPNADV
jgi:hypothetical protein